jgi:hypothetical protein
MLCIEKMCIQKSILNDFEIFGHIYNIHRNNKFKKYPLKLEEFFVEG